MSSFQCPPTRQLGTPIFIRILVIRLAMTHPAPRAEQALTGDYV